MSTSLDALDPVLLAQEIGQRYIDYLKTTFAFRDPDLRQSFETALDQGTLTDGPWLESTPVFRRTCETRDLLRDVAGPDVDPGLEAVLDPTRRLYAHQEQAIRRLVNGRNVIVATGTGSGKTEAFLYPVLLDLYRHPRSAPGVRALILYPMNALANDQRRRLGDIAKALEQHGSPFRFTFGRYTGETPEDETDSRRNARHHRSERLSGELVLRSEMRLAPPDILLTNYSMLEYLLLRPDDSPLFDDGRGATWRFLILDEAHQYGGTRGLEMAMLLRRLKQRLRDGGLSHDLRCVATSASLASEEGDRDRLAAFAEELFGEPFAPEDVLLGEVAPPVSTGGFSLDPVTCGELAVAMRNADDVTARDLLTRLSTERGLPVGDATIPEQLHRLLTGDERTVGLRLALQEPGRLDDVAARVFGEATPPGRVRHLVDLVDLLNRTENPDTRNPLLSVRYHFFLRALEGAFVSYLPGRRVALARGGSSGVAEEGAWFEVALCRECGQHYLVGQRRGDTFREALRDAGDEQFGVSYLRPLDGNGSTDAAFAEDGEAGERAVKTCRLCVRCGSLSRLAAAPVEPSCGHAASIRVQEQEVREEQKDQALRCSACTYHGPDPVREVVHGNDGPNAVVATVLHRMLPQERRKVLAFADGRQEAAYFPVYLDETYSSARDRGLLLESVRTLATATGSELSPGDVAPHLSARLRATGVVGPADTEHGALNEAWKMVLREMVTRERRLSLEGVGLLHWFPKLPPDVAIPPVLMDAPWGLDTSEARILLTWLVDSLREDGAVELATPPGVTVTWTDLGLEGQPQSAEIGPARGRVAWDGATTRRANFLVRLLSRCSSAPVDEKARKEAAQELLREVWSVLRKAGGEEPLLSRAGDARRANLKWWRLRPLTDTDQIFRCRTCGRSQAVSIRGVCARHRCPGELEAVAAGDEDPGRRHYRRLYQESLPPRLRAEEHTAQIDRDEARAFQEDFANGRIHLLSSSTTFELGVDLGDLDTVFLRNVPPEPFNYAQRVGRAGRRPGRPGFAVTYCRRRPHDLVHFAGPARMISGRARPPVLRLTNAKIVSRHVTAVVMSDFFRKYPDHFASVDALFRLSTGPDSVRATDLVRAHAVERRQDIESRLRSVVPNDLHEKLGLDDGRWIFVVAGASPPGTERDSDQPSRLNDAETELLADYRQVRDLETSASTQRRHKDAEWARARAETIAGDDVLSFLSRKAVIPKYGFPVDVVELDLHRTRRNSDADATKVSLQRDLAIAVAEYAPHSQVVANKRLWTSYALKKVPERAWPEYEYVRCTQHGFRTWPKGSSPAGCCANSRRGHYIDPIFGFVTDREAPPLRPSRKPLRSLTTRPYFVRSHQEAEAVPMGGVAVVRRASPGDLVVLCEGRKALGFWICPQCGAGENGSHRTPLGRPCPGGSVRAALGHEFVTDVLRVRFLEALPPEMPPTFADGFPWSLAYALLQGAADALAVPVPDLNVTLNRGQEALPEIVLYDNVPGGAGLVASLEAAPMFRTALEAARSRVDGRCGCARDTSCYGCLRSYSNQFAHASLARGTTCDYLAALLVRWQE